MSELAPIPTEAERIPEFQFIVCSDSIGSDGAADRMHVLLRHIASGKVYDSRDCPKVDMPSLAGAALLDAIWFMWHDQGRPVVDFYMDHSDGPRWKK